jgi:hypothetical protein
MLFLFFGVFGGKNAFSRTLLVLGAPLSILLQTRYLKLWFKTAFYMLMDPPHILLSLLPAPEQSILTSRNLDAAFASLYGSSDKPAKGKGKALSRSQAEAKQDDEEVDGEEEEEEENDESVDEYDASEEDADE